MTDLVYSSLVEIAAAIGAKEISAAEALEAHLARIDEVNGDLNAVVQLCADRARQEAAAADAALARGDEVGQLHGVPITLKDSHDTEGVITTGGTLGASGFCAGGGFHGGGAAAGSGRNSDGEDQYARADAVGRNRQPGLRAHQQSLPTGSHAGRLQRGGRGDCGGGRIAAGHGQRHRRQHPPAVALQRHRRDQADLRPRPAHGPHRPLGHGRGRRLDHDRADGAAGRRFGLGAADHQRPRRRRSDHRGDAAGRSVGGGAGRPADRLVRGGERLQSARRRHPVGAGVRLWRRWANGSAPPPKPRRRR